MSIQYYHRAVSHSYLFFFQFLSSVMEKNYEKALHLCNESMIDLLEVLVVYHSFHYRFNLPYACFFSFVLPVLNIDPENVTCVEFQAVIKEKLEAGNQQLLISFDCLKSTYGRKNHLNLSSSFAFMLIRVSTIFVAEGRVQRCELVWSYIVLY